MCGICGIVDYRGTGNDPEALLQRMAETMRHRGPDGSGVWTEQRAGLGHTRLSIIDLAGGRQPMSNEDGSVWITYNGEVYNFRELREDLLHRGHRFTTRTDTEVIVHLYEEFGIDCVHQLRGMFAFGIWDGRTGAMYLARDRVGIKPLYYTVWNGRLIFGSEIKAILAHGGLPRQVREDALSDYLTFMYVPAPKTMFRGIFKLQPGHWLTFDSAGARTRQYWDLEPADPQPGSRDQIQADLLARLTESVRVRLVSDVPLGAFLSGGVDSSSVVAMMALAEHKPLVTVSVGFGEEAYDETPYARVVARRYRTEHHEEMVLPGAAKVVETLAWHYDEPFADYSSIPTYYVSQAARRHVTVALSGDGGDENFAGYRRYVFDLMERRARRLLPGGFARRALGVLARLYPKGDWLPRPLRAKVTLANIAADAPTAYCRSVGFMSEAEKLAFLSPDVAKCLKDYRSADIIRSHMNRAPRGDLNQLLYTDIKTYLADDILTKVDRASMAVSLEVRVPLLDHVFVELAQRIPPEMKIVRGKGKAIFRSALRHCLDHRTLSRPKQGFTVPMAEWLRGPLQSMVGDLVLASGARYADFLDERIVRKAWQRHKSRLRNYEMLLWAVLVFELWARGFLPSRPVATPGETNA